MLAHTTCAVLVDDRGVALPLSLFMMLIITLLGVALTVSSRGGVQVGTSYTAQQLAFQAAEAGLEHGREEARRLILIRQFANYTEMLGNYAESGLLIDAVALGNFNGTTGFTNGTSHDPFIPAREFGPTRYQVFITNDPADGITSPADTNERIMLTSFASGSNQVGFSALQAVFERPSMAGVDLPNLPGVINLPGPEVVIDPFQSQPANVSGNNSGGEPPDCRPTIAVTSSTSEATVEAAIPSNRLGNYTSCNPSGGTLSGVATIENSINNDPANPTNPYEPYTAHDPVLVETSNDITNVAYLQNVFTGLQAIADFTSTSDPGFTIGSVSDPKIVVVNGDLNIAGASVGAGIIAVGGELTIGGNTDYTGLILVIGQGKIVVNGGGNGEIAGAILVANTSTPWPIDARYVGIPHYRHNGGGISSAGTYNADAASGDPALRGRPLRRISFQQLRNP